MNCSNDQQVEVILARTSSFKVWIPWYFKKGVYNLITIPLFLWLVYCIAVSTLGAVVQGMALLRASYAIFGKIGLIIIVSVGWFPVIIPPLLYFSVLKNVPGLWIRPDASYRVRILTTVGVLIGFSLVSSLVYHGIGKGIGWIADRDPAVAYKAGVTGSKVP